MVNPARGWSLVAAHALLAALALASSGCLAAVAGVAAAGGAGYAYYAGKVSRDYQGSPEQVWSATHLALSELGMPVVSQDQKAGGGLIVARAGAEQVRIWLDAESAGPSPVTRVGVRVATFGDPDVSTRILNQVGTHVRAAPTLTLPPPAAVTGSTAPPPLADPGPPRAAAVSTGPVTLTPPPAQTAAPPLAPPYPNLDESAPR